MSDERFEKSVFLIISFFLNTADIIFLYSIPVLIFINFQYFAFIGVIFALRFAARLAGYFLINLRLNKYSYTFLYLICFSLAFIIVILVNKFYSTLMLPLLVVIEAFFYEFFAYASQRFIEEKGKAGTRLPSFFFIISVFSFMITPLFLHDYLAENNYISIFEVFSLITAIAALLFLGVVNKRAKKPPVSVFNKNIIFNFLKTPRITFGMVLLSFIKVGFYVLGPLMVVSYLIAGKDILLFVPLFFLPRLVLSLVKYSFPFRVYSYKLLFILILFSGFLFAGFMVPDMNLWLILSFLAGTTVSVAEDIISSLSKRIFNTSPALINFYFFTKNIGFLVGALVMTFFASLTSIEMAFALSGSLVGMSVLVYTAKFYFEKWILLKR